MANFTSSDEITQNVPANSNEIGNIEDNDDELERLSEELDEDHGVDVVVVLFDALSQHFVFRDQVVDDFAVQVLQLLHHGWHTEYLEPRVKSHDFD